MPPKLDPKAKAAAKKAEKGNFFFAPLLFPVRLLFQIYGTLIS